jgi:hypothetical protein
MRQPSVQRDSVTSNCVVRVTQHDVMAKTLRAESIGYTKREAMAESLTNQAIAPDSNGDVQQGVQGEAEIQSNTAEPQALARRQHGLYIRSRTGLQVRDRKVRRLMAKLRGACAWLQPSDEPAARGWAELEILASTVFADLMTHGLKNAKDEPRRLLADYRGLRGLQLQYAKELGLTPQARAELGIKALDLLDASPEDYARRVGPD